MRSSLPAKWASYHRRHITPLGQWVRMVLFVVVGLLVLFVGYLRAGNNIYLLWSILSFFGAYAVFYELGWYMIVEEKESEIQELKRRLDS